LSRRRTSATHQMIKALPQSSFFAPLLMAQAF